MKLHNKNDFIAPQTKDDDEEYERFSHGYAPQISGKSLDEMKNSQ